MKFSYNWLSEYIDKIPPIKQLVSDLTMRSFEIDSFGQEGKDWIVDIKVLPNRAFDCLSHLGMAQEIAAVANRKFKEPKTVLKEEKSLNINNFLSVEVKEKKLCPRYSARVIVDVKVGSSPEWLQERLISCGLRPINNIVDIVNYVMLEFGQPLHAFDLDKLSDKKIIIRNAQPKEKILTLDEQKSEISLDQNILVIADSRQPVAIAGIKGGKTPEVGASTKRIVIEAANFNPKNIRKSSRFLGLRTDASWRFENGVDINLTIKALNQASFMIAKIAGGKIVSGVIDVAGIKKQPWIVTVKHGYIESLLGIKIKSPEVLKVFSRLSLSVKQIKKGKEIFYQVKIPTRRADLISQEDLIEEIGRLLGYENIISKMPSGVLIPSVKEEVLIYADKIRDILTGVGYSEVYNYSFISEADKQNFNLQNLAELNNPLSHEQKYLRPNLAIGLINNLKDNLKYFLPGSGFTPKDKALRLFEIGHVFSEVGHDFGEEKRISGLIYLKNEKKKDAAFYEIKGAVETLCHKLGLSDEWSDSHIQEGLPANWKSIFYQLKTAQIKSGEKILGWIGEINPKIASDLGIDGKASIFEIDFSILVKLVNEEKEYKPPSKFPAITRDLAILVSATTKTEEILNIIENNGGDLLVDVDLFDIYEGKDLTAKNKSLAFHLIFQSDEKNLSDNEINRLMEKIIKSIENKGWKIRK